MTATGRHLHRFARPALAMLILGCAGIGARVAASPSTPHRHAAAGARDRVRERTRPPRAVRRDPRVAPTRRFLHKAALVDDQLPITVRLNRATDGSGSLAPSDDVVQIEYDTSTEPWPVAQWQPPPAPVTSTLSGSFAMQLDFGADTSGYGSPGVLETTQGQAVAVTGTGFPVAGDGACPSPVLAAADPVAFTSAGTTRGAIDLVRGTIRGSLKLFAGFGSDLATACGTTVRTLANGPSLTPLPVAFAGSFRLSPAITADGRVRLGVMVADAATIPQASSFGFVHSCTEAPPSCADQAFPARLSTVRLTAELLVGR